MSLDQNLFTLAIAASTEEGGALDLTDPNTNTIYYRKRINPPTTDTPYSWGLWGKYFVAENRLVDILPALAHWRFDVIVNLLLDPTSEGLLCTVTAPSAASKQKIIELHNPEAKVELSFAGSLSVFVHTLRLCRPLTIFISQRNAALSNGRSNGKSMSNNSMLVPYTLTSTLR